MKIRTFWRTFFQSLTSPAYYLDVLNVRLSFSLTFFFAGYVFLAVFATLFFNFISVPNYQRIFQKNANELINSFPQDLQIQWDGQKLKINRAQTLAIPYPQEIPHDQLPPLLANLAPAALTLDQATSQVSQPSLFVISQSQLAVNNSQGGWSTISLSDLPGFEQPFSITSQSLPNYIQNWRTYFSGSLHLLGLFFPVLYLFGIGLIRLVSLAVNIVFIFYLMKILGKPLSYKKVFQLGLHISVVAGLVDILTTFVIHGNGFNLYGLAFWLYFIFVLLSLWNVRSMARGIKR